MNSMLKQNLRKHSMNCIQTNFRMLSTFQMLFISFNSSNIGLYVRLLRIKLNIGIVMRFLSYFSLSTSSRCQCNGTLFKFVNRQKEVNGNQGNENNVLSEVKDIVASNEGRSLKEGAGENYKRITYVNKNNLERYATIGYGRGNQFKHDQLHGETSQTSTSCAIIKVIKKDRCVNWTFLN
uniref:Uncharacterized protein n=1 Tax=Glossina brevipalpis TaxID=37001 RepID=A0A1A9WXA9_9MUSC